MRRADRKKQLTTAMVEKNLTKKYSDFFIAFPLILNSKYTWSIAGIEKTGAIYFDLFLLENLVASRIIHPKEIDESAIAYISTIACNYDNPHLGKFLFENMRYL